MENVASVAVGLAKSLALPDIDQVMRASARGKEGLVMRGFEIVTESLP